MFEAVGSNLTIFKLEPTARNMSQHAATGWPNARKKSTVRKKKASGTFTCSALRTKTLKERIKTHEKTVSHSSSTRAMPLVLERRF